MRPGASTLARGRVYCSGTIRSSILRRTAMFKIEIEDGHGLWSDVCDADCAV